jgi:hypothetical protein
MLPLACSLLLYVELHCGPATIALTLSIQGSSLPNNSKTSLVNNAASGALSGMFASALLQVECDAFLRFCFINRFPFQPLDVLRTRMQQVG